MKIIEPSVELIDDVNAADVYRKIERCGRVCYQSKPKGDVENFVRMLIERGHESVLEHVSLTFHIITDRAIMSELTRHRLASFSVESTRYVKYDELTFIKPEFWALYRESSLAYRALTETEQEYSKMVSELKVTPEQARAVLPLCLKSELYMTANLREWRHILKLRINKAAHPQMRFIANQILNILRDKLPVIVEDIGGTEHANND